MAADWIKMRVDLSDDPAVFIIATAVGVTEDAVVGKLHRLWSWADKHTTAGFAPGITEKWADRFVGCKGFSAAMTKAGWLEFSDAGVQFPRFDRHNGHSAKVRAEAMDRQRLSRAERDGPAKCLPNPVTDPSQKTVTTVTNLSEEKCDEIVTREEKRRREEKPPYPPATGGNGSAGRASCEQVRIQHHPATGRTGAKSRRESEADQKAGDGAAAPRTDSDSRIARQA